MKLASYFFIALGLILVLFFIIIPVTDKKSPIEVDVYNLHSSVDTVQTFSQSVIIPGKILISAPSATMRIVAPRNELDPWLISLLLLGILVAFIFFRDFSILNPFTKKTLLGVRVIFWGLLIFYITNFWRETWFDGHIRELTNNQYAFKRPGAFSTPVFWLMLILLRIVGTFKKGFELQNEADLTV